jgi:hypothetical protein
LAFKQGLTHTWHGVSDSPAVLPLEEVGSRPDFLGCNQWPAVPGVQDHNSSPQAFRRAGGRSHSLDWRQNRWPKPFTQVSGRSLHGRHMESRGGTHRVAPKAVAELKAQAKAKFHMYCFDLH